MRPLKRNLSLLLIASLASGCSLVLPEVSTMPVVHNPFPQLSQVAVAPFINLSDESTVDGRKFAMAYFAELQSIPGFEVVPLGVVEETMIAQRIDLSSPGDARRLAKLLGVDAVVVGAVTDYSPYYPPRCGMRVEWYAANPGFHEIPAGYGLPWGTPDEEYIPEQFVYEAEMALARAQMETQTPACPPEGAPAMLPNLEFARPMQPKPLRGMLAPSSPSAPFGSSAPAETGSSRPDPFESGKPESLPVPPDADPNGDYEAPNDTSDASESAQDDANENDNVVWRPARQATFKPAIDLPHAGLAPDAIDNGGAIAPLAENNFYASGGANLPPNWPDPRGFMPPAPSPVRPECVPNAGPVMTHTRIFHGHDPDITAALAAYVDFRDDARFGGWRSYLERSDDFIRFCCHLHLSDMLSARGGATETRVVRHWSNVR